MRAVERQILPMGGLGGRGLKGLQGKVEQSGVCCRDVTDRVSIELLFLLLKANVPLLSKNN